MKQVIYFYLVLMKYLSPTYLLQHSFIIKTMIQVGPFSNHKYETIERLIKFSLVKRGKEALGKEMEWRGSEGALETEGHFGAGRFISGDDYTLRTLHPPLAPGLPPPIPLGGSSLVI